MSRTEDTIHRLLEKHDALTSGLVAREAGVSRQVAHRRLRALVDAGLLVVVGAGRATRYQRVAHAATRHNLELQRPAELAGSWSAQPGAETWLRAIEGLREDQLWRDVAREASALAELDENVLDIVHYAITELVNNAIDHARARQVSVTVARRDRMLLIAVDDDGIGIFAHVQDELRLASELEAIQDLSKGKVTTMPERHTGEGLFFTSKAVDRFEISSGRLTWVVDNVRDDVAIIQHAPRSGTAAVLEVDHQTTRDIRNVFDAYTEDFEFTRTRAVVRLFAVGVRFVSRSEAKRLVQGLDRFREVILDFAGVDGVGQGFADEVFRVWASAHPLVTLRPMNMNEPVAFMVNRATQP